ncbi:DUF5906 domain-containing protein [Sphingobium sp. KCTC 72723]|uniref:DUF5906 domain-containing protein n=1 Tax=Sphingobium sp. KCTC 72723 TaxID=2733867 RepID=UPI00165D8ABF|nr:DUF5906 domain-containing protein [Sphingobium sp. KCTC 72723]
MNDFNTHVALYGEDGKEDLTPIGLSADDREAYNAIQDRPIVERVAEGVRAGNHKTGGIVAFPGDARGNEVLDALPAKERNGHDRLLAAGFRATAYDYPDAEGQLLMQVVHYRHESERKQVRVLRYCGRSETTGENVFWWTSIPGTRPLCGLNILADCPESLVLVVEGEKAAAAARVTFIAEKVICWPGGATTGAIDRVDMSALNGRTVVGWPDNDPVGRNGMRRFLARAIEAGAKSAAMVLVPPEFPPKWDLADQIPVELHTNLLSDLIKTARPMSKSEARQLLHDPVKKAAARRILGLKVGYSRVDKDAVETCLSLIDPDESGHWHRILRSLYFAFGTAAVDMADEWSRRGAKYREGEPQRLFNKYAQDTAFTADSLLWLFRAAFNASLDVGDDKPNVAIDFAAFALAHVENMNRDHAIVTRGSRTVVMEEIFDERFDRYTVDYLPKQAFQDRYVMSVPVGTSKEGDPVFKPRGKHWFDDGRRRQFDRIMFLPGHDKPQTGVLNSWRGFAVEAVDNPEGWALLKRHLRENVCNRDDASFAYLMNWLAGCVQWLRKPLGVALVLMGYKGAGKSILIQLLAHLFGEAAFVTALADDVLGKFNARLESTLLLGLEEAVAASNRTQDGIFKDLITRPTLRVEDKFFSNWTAPNHLRMIMTSNNDHVVRADARERRYAVFEVTNPHQDDPDARRRYFGDLIEQMETGGYEAMLGELLARDITGWNPESIPETDALRQQKLLNLSNDPVAAWYFSRLQDGINILSGEAETPAYPWSQTETRWVPVAAVMKDYRYFARQLGHRGDEQRIKTRLTRFMPRGFDTKNLRDPNDPNRGQARMYPFPPLAEARKLFERATGYTVPVSEEGGSGERAVPDDDGPTPF